jgi:isopentenyl diphosphate isomerase/L-lactate dehydrogenase-like FMN-dependent dehydrogenase
MCLTVDTVVAGNRERDHRTGFSTPPRLTLGSLLSFMLHPDWSLNYLFREKFTLANIVMIVVSIVLIVLEVKRAKMLRYVNAKKERALEAYKPFGLKILYSEFVLILLVSIWVYFI